MLTILYSFLLVAASEMGDKTQLLALVLVSRFRAPWVIMSGILVATLANHAFASWSGSWIAAAIPPDFLRLGLAVTFFAFGAWLLIPDKPGELETTHRFGAFITTTVAFFLAEMGDKTQLATLALGAKYDAPFLVTIGTTLGMLFADGLAVFYGEKVTRNIPMNWIRGGACFLFIVFGIAILAGV